MPLSITTLSLMTFRLTTVSIKGLFVTLRVNDTQHNCTHCLYAECQVSFIVMLNFIRPSVIMLNAVGDSVVAPKIVHGATPTHCTIDASQKCAMDKHCCSFVCSNSDEEKKFNDIDPRRKNRVRISEKTFVRQKFGLLWNVQRRRTCLDHRHLHAQTDNQVKEN